MPCNYLWGTIGHRLQRGQWSRQMPNDAGRQLEAMFSTRSHASKFKMRRLHPRCAVRNLRHRATSTWARIPTAEARGPAAAEKVLHAIRPYIRNINSSEYIEDLANGEICLALGWSGDILQARDRADEAGKGVEIKYIDPEGRHGHVLRHARHPADAQHPKNAYVFINYLMRPEVCREELQLRQLRQQQRGLAAAGQQGSHERPGHLSHRRGGQALEAGARLGGISRQLHATHDTRMLARSSRPVSKTASAPATAPHRETPRTPWKDPQRRSPYVRIESVTKKFGDFVAVDDVSLKIYKGEIFCLLGGSGCGKTTLLRMLAGFETPTSGRILHRRPGHGGHPALRAPGQHDVPVLCAVSRT